MEAKSKTYEPHPVCTKEPDKVMKIMRVLNVNLFAVHFVDEKRREETVCLLQSSVKKISTELMNHVDVHYQEINIIMCRWIQNINGKNWIKLAVDSHQEI